MMERNHNLSKINKIFDISLPLGPRTAAYPGDPKVCLERISEVENGDLYSLSRLTLSTHSGTHLDYPAHFIPGGACSEDYGADSCMLEVHVVDWTENAETVLRRLEAANPAPGEGVLLRLPDGIRNRPEDVAVVSPVTLPVARWCVERKLQLVGINALSIEEDGSGAFPVHRELLGNGVLILEGLWLEEVAEGRYGLLCCPLRLEGAEASPVRALLFEGG